MNGIEKWRTQVALSIPDAPLQKLDAVAVPVFPEIMHSRKDWEQWRDTRFLSLCISQLILSNDVAATLLHQLHLKLFFVLCTNTKLICDTSPWDVTGAKCLGRINTGCSVQMHKFTAAAVVSKNLSVKSFKTKMALWAIEALIQDLTISLCQYQKKLAC